MKLEDILTTDQLKNMKIDDSDFLNLIYHLRKHAIVVKRFPVGLTLNEKYYFFDDSNKFNQEIDDLLIQFGSRFLKLRGENRKKQKNVQNVTAQDS